MRISSTVVLSGLLAVAVQAVPQGSATSTATAAATSAAPAPTVSQTPQEICLGKCKPGDVDCQAACMVVPAPNESMANDTHDCAAKCNQGSGSPEDTDKYSACVQSCITSHFFSAGSAPTPAPNSPGSSGTVAGSGSATATGTAGTGKATGTPASGSATGSAAASGTAGSTGAANSMQVGTSFAGIAGIMAAIFAL